MVIGAWGDSITYGGGDEAALGWVGRLRKKLYESGCEVYNRGVCGDTSAEILERFDIEADSIEPDVIILAVGINDSKFPNGGRENAVPADAFQKNVERLTDAALSRTRSVIILGLTEVSEQKITGTSSVFQNESIAAYNKRLWAIAKERGVVFIEMAGVLDARFDLEDGLHPNGKGHEKMFRAVLPFIE